MHFFGYNVMKMRTVLIGQVLKLGSGEKINIKNYNILKIIHLTVEYDRE